MRTQLEKRMSAAAFAAGFAALMLTLAGCGGTDDAGGVSGASPAGSAAPSEATLNLYLNRSESVDAFKKLKEVYEAAYPNITLNIETSQGGEFNTNLKTKFAAGAGPDIFTNSGFTDLDTWVDKMEDLSGSEWESAVLDRSLDGITKDGKVYGYPLSMEGYGFMYNKDDFAKAGISEAPKTMTELKDAVAKLEAAGFKAFVPDYGNFYVPGVFETNNAVAKQSDPNQFLSDLKSGAKKITEDPLFSDMLDLVQLQTDHASKNPMSIDYTGMITDFAAGKGAITLGCSCSQPLLDQTQPSFEVGVFGTPLNDDADLNDRVFVQVSSYLAINKDSKVKEEAKRFIDWLYSSDAGREWYVKDFRYLPVLKGLETDAASLGSIGAGIKAYMDQGKYLAYEYPKYPEGLTTEWGNTLIKMVAGKLDKQQTLAELQAVWEKMSK
ncbi:extracellular solute-binding protein [Cohnella xylanilytica]|uniref:Extracellular solute-binding protein n=1 Tax=Cohnella xylanilytica TaxID=557555 RepID=A0A841U483_9BACL|nr:extracellular solute-binding protein [Cohnella xylanilytica]MBB6695406.1 extracellular solute-binding protein [Cohnella xylanilytica]